MENKTLKEILDIKFDPFKVKGTELETHDAFKHSLSAMEQYDDEDIKSIMNGLCYSLGLLDITKKGPSKEQWREIIESYHIAGDAPDTVLKMSAKELKDIRIAYIQRLIKENELLLKEKNGNQEQVRANEE